MSAAGSERRLVQRFPGGTIRAVLVRTDPAAPALAAHVWDFSVKGIGLLVNADFLPDTQIVLQTTSPKIKSRDLAAEVRHSAAMPDGRRLVGCRFFNTLTMEDLLALG